MGMLLGFVAGYVMRSMGREESLDDIVVAVQAIRESDEFHDLVKTVRSHASHTLRGLATIVERGWRSPDETGSPTDLVERVRLIVGRR